MTYINHSGRGTNRGGSSLVYFVASLAVLMGFCSLAVDLGRAQTAKTELRRVADAAARAAAYQLQIGSSVSTIQSAAAGMATHNPVDGGTITIAASDVQLLNWTSSTTYTVISGTTTGANAVRVYARRITSDGGAIPLFFASLLGKTSVDVSASSVAQVTSVTENLNVNATSNLWLAGEPNGTQASEPDALYPSTPNHQWKYDLAGPYGTFASTKDAYGDPVGEPYASPAQVSLTGGLIPGATITVSVATSTGAGIDQARKAPNDPYYSADGDGTAEGDAAATDSSAPGYTGAGNGASPSDATGSEHNIANISVPGDSLMGVFLDANVPESDGTPPPGLDFDTSSQQNYSSISPLTRQPFMIGNGQTSSSTQQTITVPSDATRLFLGSMDGHEWSNNAGYYNVTITQTFISLVQ